MEENPLEVIKKLDPEFYSEVSRIREFTFTDGALSAKMKYLIALALDAVQGAAGGVRALALQALENGASKDEIMESLHIAHYVGGVGSVYTASFGLKDVF